MASKNTWASFYDQASAPNGTSAETAAAEVERLLPRLEIAPGASVLDIGCGLGNQVCELARRGMKPTGLDISSRLIAEAEQQARDQYLAADWTCIDSLEYRSMRPFDAILSLHQGALGLLNEGDDPLDRDLALLRNMAASLHTGGRLILSAISLAHAAQEAIHRPEIDFDPATSTTNSGLLHPGIPAAPGLRVRAYAQTEITILLRLAGFDLEHMEITDTKAPEFLLTAKKLADFA